MTRRQFLATVGAVSLGPTLRFPVSLPPRRLESIGVQLYSVRRLLARDWAGTIAAVAALGYRELEFAGYFEQPPAEIKRLLDQHGLTAPAGHFAKEVLLAPSAEAYETAAAVGHQWLIVAWIDAEERSTLNGWRRIADEMNRIGERCRKAGMRFAYHNEDYDFMPNRGRLPYDVLLEATDPHLVDLEIDLYWMVKGGQDSAMYLPRTAGRTPLVHIKDTAGVPNHRQVDVGRGKINWKRVLGAAWRAGVRHYFVEHDDPEDPLGFCRASYDYLTRLEF